MVVKQAGGHTGSGGSGGAGLDLGPMRQPPPPPGYEKCIAAALMAVLASGETPGEPDSGYGTLVRGTVVSAPFPYSIFLGASNIHLDPSSISGQPQMYVQVHPGDSPRAWSSAFGRYQITNTTAKYFNFTDFSPAGQNAAATTMLGFYDAIKPAMQGDLVRAVWNMWPWASMPDSPLPGNQLSWQQVKDTFQNALETLPECQ